VSPAERRSPGLEALFRTLRDDGSHSILDFGPATSEHLRFLGRFSRRIRFAGLLPDPPRGDAWREAVQRLPPNLDQPYDVVFAWNILDRIDPGARPALITRLDELTAPGTRLFAVVDASGGPTIQPTRTTLLARDRVAETPVGDPEPAHPPLLPAPIERLLTPFKVTAAYTLRSGHREYVATKTKEARNVSWDPY
jgi:hypothetical protein